MKPIGKAQGKGIFIFKNIKEIAQWKNTYRYNPDNPTVKKYMIMIFKPIFFIKFVWYN